MNHRDADVTLSIVCATLGERLPELRRLLESIACRTGDWYAVEVVLVVQGSAERAEQVRQIVSEAPQVAMVRHISRLGASGARNAGIAYSSGALLAFPDDDCWYPPETLERSVGLFATAPSMDILCGMQVTSEGRPSMLRWRQRPALVNRFNIVRTVICSSMFVRRRVVDRVGGFAEDLGPGADTSFGAGEETDFVLRSLAEHFRVTYRPMLRVYQEDVRPTRSTSFQARRVAYGAGIGEVFRRHEYPGWYSAYLVARKCALILLLLARGKIQPVGLETAWLRGFVTGLLGRA